MSAASVQPGDQLFIWWSGRGWLAHCQYLDEPSPGEACPAPWREFRFVSPMRVLADLDPPHRSPGNPEPLSVLPTIRLGQFPRLDDARAVARVHGLFRVASGTP